MTTLYVSKMEVNTDELGRYITTLTQEIFSKINENEEKIFRNVLIEVDSNEGNGEYIEYHNDDYTIIDVKGVAIQKAIYTINSINKVIALAPITEIEDDSTYRVEIEY